MSGAAEEMSAEEMRAVEMRAAETDAPESGIAATPARSSRLGAVAGWAWIVVLTLIYALTAINAVGNLVGMRLIAASLDTSLSGGGWFWLIVGIALPLLVYAAALILSRGRKPGARVLVLFAGVAFVSAIQLEIMHLVPQFSYFAL